MKGTVTIAVEEYLDLVNFKEKMTQDCVARIQHVHGLEYVYLTKDDAIKEITWNNEALANKANRIQSEMDEMRRQRKLYENEIRKEIEKEVWSKHNLWGSFKRFIGMHE